MDAIIILGKFLFCGLQMGGILLRARVESPSKTFDKSLVIRIGFTESRCTEGESSLFRQTNDIVMLVNFNKASLINWMKGGSLEL